MAKLGHMSVETAFSSLLASFLPTASYCDIALTFNRMTEASLSFVDSPRSDNEDLDQVTLTSRFLAKVRAEEEAGGSYGKLTGLASPEYGRYTPKAGLSTRNVQRYSLISNSSDGSASPMTSAWRAPAFASPSFKSGSARTPSCPYSISLVDDELSSSISPLDSALSNNARWAANSPQASTNGSSYPRSTLNSWSTTISSTPSGTSSSENTQTMSWSSSPFKFTPQPSTQKENHSPNLLSTIYTPKTPAHDGLSKEFAQTLSQSTTPSGLPQSPSTLVSPPSNIASFNLSSLSRNNSATKDVQVAKHDSTNIASLVDLNGSFSNQQGSDSTSSPSYNTSVQREFDSLTQGVGVFSLSSQFAVGESSEVGPELDSSLSETTISNLNAFIPQNKTETRKTTETGVSTAPKSVSSARVSLLPAPTSYSEEVVAPKESKEKVTEMMRILMDVMCDTVNISREAWLKPIRPLFTFEDLLALSLGSSASEAAQQELMDDALITLMESGEVEALDLQEDDEQASVTRLYRASAESFSPIEA